MFVEKKEAARLWCVAGAKPLASTVVLPRRE
jgi:hypothetical protein